MNQRNAFLAAVLISLSYGACAGTIDDFESLDCADYYIGVQADYAWQQVRGSSKQLQFNGNNLILTGKAPITSEQEVFSGQIFVGHNITRNNFILGTEVGVEFFDDSSNRITISNVTGDLTVSSYVGEISPQYNAMLSILPGYQVDSMTYYGRLGGGFTKFKTTETSVINNQISPEVFSIIHSECAWTPELTLGVGVKKAFNNNFSVRVEYIYKQTQRFDEKSNDARSTTNVNVVRATDNSYKTTSHNVGIGVLYEIT